MQRKIFDIKQLGQTDLARLQTIISSLEVDQRIAIYMRFWSCCLIEEIASTLGLSWSETDQLIENSITELRNGFLKNQLSVRLLAA